MAPKVHCPSASPGISTPVTQGCWVLILLFLLGVPAATHGERLPPSQLWSVEPSHPLAAG